MSFRKVQAVAIALLIFAVVWIVNATAQQPNQVGEFMRAKLTHSQKVLEGLALEDYDLITQNAQRMSLLSQAANWQVLQTPEYVQFSADFRRAADAVRDAGKNKNLDGAALAYMEMTMKCIACHKYVRNVQMANAAPVLPRTPNQDAVAAAGTQK